MVEVRKKPRENALSLVRRFSLKVRMSGVLVEARKRQYHKSPLTKRDRKEKTLRRLKKSGKIK